VIQRQLPVQSVGRWHGQVMDFSSGGSGETIRSKPIETFSTEVVMDEKVKILGLMAIWLIFLVGSFINRGRKKNAPRQTKQVSPKKD